MDELYGGAVENVSVASDTVYVFFCWYTPLMYTNVKFSPKDAELKVKDKFFDYNSSLFFRTNVDIIKSSSGKYYPITATAVTNMRDPNGDPVWINTENLKTKAETVKTKYEIKTIIPSFDMFHNIGMYRVFLTRSANQKWDIPEW